LIIKDVKKQPYACFQIKKLKESYSHRRCIALACVKSTGMGRGSACTFRIQQPVGLKLNDTDALVAYYHWHPRECIDWRRRYKPEKKKNRPC
jgi:hypothetical protein